MNAYEKATELGLTGTSQEIVDQLIATGLTNKAVSRAELIHILNMRGMLTKIVGNNSDEKWTGSVLVMQDAIIAGGTAEQKDGIRKWLSHITNPTNMLWDTTHVAFSAPFWQMYKTFADLPTMPSTEDFTAIADLGGGWVFADLTVEQYEAEAAAVTTAAAKQAAIDAALVPMRSRLNAIETWLATPSVLELSLVDLQAFIADILSTPDGNPSGGE
jgi:hypothetical protein